MVGIREKLSYKLLAMTLKWCWDEKDCTYQSLLKNCPHTFSQVIHRPDWVLFYWWQKSSIAALLQFFQKPKALGFIYTGEYMIYRKHSKIPFRPQIKKSFQVSRLTWDAWAMTKPFVSVGITRFVLVFGKRSNIHFLSEGRYKTIVSKQVENQFYRNSGRQRGQGFTAFVQGIGRTTTQFCVKISFQLQNASVLTCWNLLRQELQRLLMVERCPKQLQRVWEDRFWKNSWVVSAGKRTQAEPFQQNLQNKPVDIEETFVQKFLINHVEQFSVQTFCGSFWNSWGESPSSWQCLSVPRTKS